MFPEQATVYDWCYDQQGKAWVLWMATIPEFKCDPDKTFSDVRGLFRGLGMHWGWRACARVEYALYT